MNKNRGYIGDQYNRSNRSGSPRGSYYALHGFYVDSVISGRCYNRGEFFGFYSMNPNYPTGPRTVHLQDLLVKGSGSAQIISGRICFIEVGMDVREYLPGIML